MAQNMGATPSLSACFSRTFHTGCHCKSFSEDRPQNRAKTNKVEPRVRTVFERAPHHSTASLVPNHNSYPFRGSGTPNLVTNLQHLWPKTNLRFCYGSRRSRARSSSCCTYLRWDPCGTSVRRYWLIGWHGYWSRSRSRLVLHA